MNEASNPHDQTVIELLREDPSLADVYLATALEEVNEPGGQFALLAALRQIAEAPWHGKCCRTSRNQTGNPLSRLVTKGKSNH